MKTAALFISILLALATSAQISGEKYKQEELIKFYHEISKYELRTGDTLVDVGTGNGEHAQLVFRFFPTTYYILTDLKPISKKLPYSGVYIKGRRYTFERQSEFVLGTDSTIPLPSSAFRRVLCRQTFHEFSNPSAMLAELKRILTDDGLLIVVEAIPNYENQIDPGCKHAYWKKEDLVESFEANGFRLVSSDVTMYDAKKSNGNLNILKFRKS